MLQNVQQTAGINMSKFAKKAEVDKLDIDELEATPVDLSKLNNVVKTNAKKTIFNELVEQINAIQTINGSDLIKKADYNTKIAEM